MKKLQSIHQYSKDSRRETNVCFSNW